MSFAFVDIQKYETRLWELKLYLRFLWTSGILLNLGLIVWVGFLIPSLGQVPLGFDPFGAPVETAPSVRLILLPLISGLLFIVGFVTGLYFYRREKQRPLAFVIWISSALCTVLFLMAVLFLVMTPV